MLTLPFSSSLAAAITPTATRLRLMSGMTAVCAQLATHWVTFNLFNASASEVVLATGCVTEGGVQYITVQRGFGGTTPRAWAFETCACAGQIVAPCGPDTVDPACGTPLAGVVAEGCLEIDRTNPTAPVIRLPEVFPAPITTPGIDIDRCGRITRISQNFPLDVLPAFNPCGTCGSGTGSPATSAEDVSYNAPFGSQFALGDTVAAALAQLDVAMQAYMQQFVGALTGLTVGDGLDMGGTTTEPEISLEEVGTPGVYGGFTIDKHGRVTDYDATPGVELPTHTVNAPATISYNPTTNTYAHGVAAATTTALGAVTLADPAQVAAGTADPDDVITFLGLTQKLAASGMTPLSDLALVTTADDADKFLIYSTAAPGNRAITLPNLTREVGGAYVCCEFTGATGAVLFSKGIAVTRVSAGVYTLALSSPGALPSAYTVHAMGIDTNTCHFFTCTRTSATAIELRAFTCANVATDPTRVGVIAIAI